MTFFYFLSSLVITRSILDLTLPVTQLLQGPGIYIANATHLIESLKGLICCKRNTVDTFHKKCYSDILQLPWKVGIEECQLRTSMFKETVIMSYHDQRLIIQKSSHNSFTVEKEIRFGYASILVYNRFVIILSKMVSLVYKNVNWKEKFNLFAVLFKDGSPCSKALEVELDL